MGRAHRPRQRARTLSIRDGLQELKFLRSVNDLRILYEKIAYLLFRKVGMSQRFDGRAPYSLQIEPTNYCNVNCICCPSLRSSRSRGFMDFELFRQVIDEASQMGVKRIRLFLHGEPMLHPRIIDMIRHLKSRQLAINLTTNGMRLNRSKIEEILHSGVNSADHITFSILGSSKETFERIMQRANYYTVTQNIHDFLQLRKEYKVNGPVIETIFYSMPENENEEQEYLEHWGRKVDHARLGGKISESFAGYGEKLERIAPRRQTCSNIWDRLTIYWNGEVPLCNEDVNGERILGNVNQRSLQEIWNCEELRLTKQAHVEKRFQDLPLCSRCDM